ncbi:tyrosine-type recombinase/integrase [Nocardioides sp. R1-1]|uniref:tyrosine-type recombinase/integrase n=1 Tax=Nocardioides sp. R1-1 TaxID=3383502 RepID=UPI0038CF574D
MARRKSPTVQQAVDQYLALRKKKFAHDTWVNDRSQLMRFAEAVGRSRQMHTLTPEDVEDFFFTGKQPLSEQMAPSSFNKVRSRVSTWLDFCRRRQMIEGDLMAEVDRLPVMKRERLRLSPVELLDLPNYTDTARDRCLIILATNTALRASEITSLRLRDVDLDGGWLRVEVHKSRLEDVMPITAELDAALRTWLTTYTDLVGPLHGDWYLFPTRGSGRSRYGRDGSRTHEYGPLSPEAPIKKPAVIVQRALRARGLAIRPGEGLHTVRRSVARSFFDSNVQRGYDSALRATSALLHHSSTQVTEHYLGLASEKLHRDDVLRGKPFLTAMIPAQGLRLAEQTATGS